MILTNCRKLFTGLVLATCLLLAEQGAAQRLASRYAITYLMGQGIYTLVNGTSGQGNLQFETRSKSNLYVDRKEKIPAAAIKSFTIDGHTLVPQGFFNFEFGEHEYYAEHAFIEYADTTGQLQLALYHTTEPTGDMTTYFTTYLWRRRSEKSFIVGPNNHKKGGKAYRQRLANGLGQWPELQQAVADGLATFDNFPEYMHRANQPIR